jgi:hypothetical protein
VFLLRVLLRRANIVRRRERRRRFVRFDDDRVVRELYITLLFSEARAI